MNIFAVRHTKENVEQGKRWMENYQELLCPNGESYPEMVRRVDGFLNELKGKDLEHVVVITHAGVIRIMKSILATTFLKWL